MSVSISVRVHVSVKTSAYLCVVLSVCAGVLVSFCFVVAVMVVSALSLCTPVDVACVSSTPRLL